MGGCADHIVPRARGIPWIEERTHETARAKFLSRMRPFFPLADRYFVDTLWVDACGFQKRVIWSEEEAKAYCGGPVRLEDNARH